MINSPLGRFGGMDVLVHPHLDNVPRMTVSTRFAELMPPEFIADLNAWMLEFFGTQSVAYQLPGGKIAMGPKAWASLQLQGGAR